MNKTELINKLKYIEITLKNPKYERHEFNECLRLIGVIIEFLEKEELMKGQCVNLTL